ncbi:MAG: nitrogen fixation protein NifX [Coriobacteriia bacterium]|nr:nitrogen fixation protein NifX [Coriobacteriia bacterium]
MKVAFASTRGTTVDEHFGRASAFSIYDITPNAAVFVELRRVAEGDVDVAVVESRGMGELHESAIANKVDQLADCKIVYFTEIGGPSAAKLIRRGIMPLKVERSSSIELLTENLIETMRYRPAPWMRKILASDAQREAKTASQTGER